MAMAPYRRRAGLGDTAYNPGSTGAGITATLTSEQAAAAAGSKFAQNAADELSHEAYAQAVSAGAIPAYITDPADQAKFVSLMNVINGTGFTSLSPEDQVAFNALRTTGTQDLDNALVGGKESGVYAWDPATGQGDAPPNAGVIAQAIQAHNDPNYSPAPTLPVERAINLQNGHYVYADDGSLVPQSELDRLGLKITVSPPPVQNAPSVSTGLPATDTNMSFENANPGSSLASPAVSAAPAGYQAADNSGAGVSSGMSTVEMIGLAVAGVGALYLFTHKKGRR
jgi:hypothetical protein